MSERLLCGDRGSSCVFLCLLYTIGRCPEWSETVAVPGSQITVQGSEPQDEIPD